jgi:hypothetical protein
MPSMPKTEEDINSALVPENLQANKKECLITNQKQKKTSWRIWQD